MREKRITNRKIVVYKRNKLKMHTYLHENGLILKVLKLTISPPPTFMGDFNTGAVGMLFLWVCIDLPDARQGQTVSRPSGDNTT